MNEQEAAEQAAAMRAAFDQFKESAKELAGVVVSYFQALTAGGFERGEALQLALNYQAIVVSAIVLSQPATAAPDEGEQ